MGRANGDTPILGEDRAPNSPAEPEVESRCHARTLVPDRALVNNRSAAVGLHFIHISRVFVAIGLGNRNVMPNYAAGVPFKGGKIK